MRASLCRADRQGDAVGCRVRLSPLPSGDCHCGGFKNKAELSTSKYAAGNNPVLGKIRTRSINRSLLGLLSIIFDCWEENFAREKPKPPFTPPLLFFYGEARVYHMASSGLFFTTDRSLLPALLCSSSVPTIIEKHWKEFPGERGKKMKEI